MGLSSFWANITGPRIREIQPRRQGQRTQDGRPATSSGVRTVRKTPSLEEDEGDRELNLVESLLTTNIIEPPTTQSQTALEEKKSRRRSRGLSLSRSRTEDGSGRRRSLFGGSKSTAQKEEVPDVPKLPTLSAIYSAQAPQPHHLNEDGRPGTAVSAMVGSTTFDLVGNGSVSQSPAVIMPHEPTSPLANTVGEIFELPAELPASPPPAKFESSTQTEKQVKKARRRSLGEVLSGKKLARTTDNDQATATPPLPALPPPGSSGIATSLAAKTSKSEASRSRRGSNASVASKASKTSRKSRRKSWWQRDKSKNMEVDTLPPVPTRADLPADNMSGEKTRNRQTSSPDDVDLAAFPAVPAPSKYQDDDATSIRTTGSEKAVARSKSQSSKPKKRPQSTASHSRRKRRSWWASSNPNDSDDDSNPLPPVPLLIKSTTSTPESSPTNSDNGRLPSYTAVRGDNIKAPRPLSTASTKSRPYTPRSAATSFLVSTTPVSDNVRKSVRHSLHNCEELESGFENDRGTYCLSAEQQQEWEKLKHLMAVMDRRRDATRKTFGEASVAEMFPATPTVVKDEERSGVKYSNRDALAALEVGVAK